MTDDSMQNATISDIIRPPRLLMRSINLERDFHDRIVLDGYFATPFLTSLFFRILDGLRPDSGRRAWRITGDYGVGKSSFALALARFLDIGALADRQRLTSSLGLAKVEKSSPRMFPLLVTASREALAGTMARRIRHALQNDLGPISVSERDALTEMTNDVERTCSVGAMMALMERFAALHAQRGCGLFLVLDELGKYLEYASWNPGREDVYLLQRLAEMAAGSGRMPFVVMGMLHQGWVWLFCDDEIVQKYRQDGIMGGRLGGDLRGKYRL